MTSLPGTSLLALATRWFGAPTVARVLEPLVADWQREWRDAPVSRRAWVRWRGWCGFMIAVMALAPSAFVFTPMPASMTRRVLARIIIFTSTISGLLTIPLLIDSRHLPVGQLALLTALLMPSGAALAFPFAMTWVTDAVRRRAKVTLHERIAAVRIAVTASLFAFVLMGWIVPLSNQQFRERAAPEWARPPARGVHELTTMELFARPDAAVAERRQDREAAVGREIHQRAVLSVLPAVLVWLRFAALSRPRTGRVSPLPPAIATVATILIFFPLYFLSVNIEPLLGIRSGTALWLPLAALAAWCVLESRWCRGSDESAVA